MNNEPLKKIKVYKNYIKLKDFSEFVDISKVKYVKITEINDSIKSFSLKFYDKNKKLIKLMNKKILEKPKVQAPHKYNNLLGVKNQTSPHKTNLLVNTKKQNNKKGK